MISRNQTLIVLRTTAALLRMDKDLIARLDKPEQASDIADALEDIATIFAQGFDE